jgi:hypothetical protein
MSDVLREFKEQRRAELLLGLSTVELVVSNDMEQALLIDHSYSKAELVNALLTTASYLASRLSAVEETSLQDFLHSEKLHIGIAEL